MPRPFCLLPDSKYYNPEWENYFSKHDPKLANKLLDELGLEKRDKDGFRLYKNGKRIEILLEYWDQEPVAKGPITELIKGYWENIGIKIALKAEAIALLGARNTAGNVEITNWHGGDIGESQWIVSFCPPLPGSGISYAPAWGDWLNSAGKKGEKPAEPVLQMYELSQKMLPEQSETKRIEYGKQIWDIFVKQVYEFGTVGKAPKPIIVSNRLQNVPVKNVWGNGYLWLNSSKPEQFFLKK